MTKEEWDLYSGQTSALPDPAAAASGLSCGVGGWKTDCDFYPTLKRQGRGRMVANTFAHKDPGPQSLDLSNCEGACSPRPWRDSKWQVPKGSNRGISLKSWSHKASRRRDRSLCHCYYWFSYHLSWLRTKHIKELPYFQWYLMLKFTQVAISGYHEILPVSPPENPTHLHGPVELINKKYFSTVHMENGKG